MQTYWSGFYKYVNNFGDNLYIGIVIPEASTGAPLDGNTLFTGSEHTIDGLLILFDSTKLLETFSAFVPPVSRNMSLKIGSETFYKQNKLIENDILWINIKYTNPARGNNTAITTMCHME